MNLFRDYIFRLCRFPNNYATNNGNETSSNSNSYSQVKRHRVPTVEEQVSEEEDVVTVGVATTSVTVATCNDFATVDHPSIAYDHAFAWDESSNVQQLKKAAATTPAVEGMEWQNWRRKRAIIFIGIGFALLLAGDIWLFATTSPPKTATTADAGSTNNVTNSTTSAANGMITLTNSTNSSSDADINMAWGRCGIQFLNNLSLVCLHEIIPCYLHSQCQNYSTAYNNSNSSTIGNNTSGYSSGWGNITNRILLRSRKPTNTSNNSIVVQNPVDFLCLADCI